MSMYRGGNRKTISIRETELISLIERIINEKQLLTEMYKCDVSTNAGCEGGEECMPDPGSLGNEPCCHKFASDGTNQGCGGRVNNTDTKWLRDDYDDYHTMNPCGDLQGDCPNKHWSDLDCACYGKSKYGSKVQHN